MAAAAVRASRSGPRRRVGRSLLLGAWSRPLRALGRFIVQPWTALVAFNLVMVVWHVPVLFDLAENNQDVHIWLMHASFFVTASSSGSRSSRRTRSGSKASPLWQAGAIVGTNVVMFVLAMSLSASSRAAAGIGLRPRSGSHPAAVRRPADRRGHSLGLWRLLGCPGARLRAQESRRPGRQPVEPCRPACAPWSDTDSRGTPKAQLSDALAGRKNNRVDPGWSVRPNLRTSSPCSED